MIKEKNSKAQIWIETVVYTLIALIMIGAVLAFAQPKIQEIQDKLIIDKTFDAIREIDSQINSVINGGVGNKRVINLEIKKGELKIDPLNNEIVFTLKDSRSVYSEPGKDVKLLGIKMKTIKTGKTSVVTLTKNYDSEGIQLTASESSLILGKSASVYTLTITNEGSNNIKISVGS
jgi:type II secretory pathway pseudopilin PulG